jgi:hypothetical protein
MIALNAAPYASASARPAAALADDGGDGGGTAASRGRHPAAGKAEAASAISAPARTANARRPGRVGDQ